MAPAAVGRIRSDNGRSDRTRGFTLIELMIAVAIIAILATIAYPSYRQQVLKSQRTEAKTALSDAAQRLERCYTQFNAYNDTDNCTIAGTLDSGGTYDTEEGHYTISAVTLTATAFTLEADRKDNDDSRCPDMRINHLGQRGSDGSVTTDTHDCW
ncbi:type IV pilin protein [Algiphilus sp.]|uniref:type IV pilin protein n=1 Tax=Algiphilus sp. TaxID=1872431 RepID=UPI003451CF60